MSRVGHRTLALLLAWAILAPGAVARAAGWHSAQPPAPAAPEGQPGIGVPVPLGQVGQISFWAPNHGLLITDGTATGGGTLYYYNGVSWSELSTVCGGSEGRIAWAGENNFWTIANQQVGQQFGAGSVGASANLSLCHFEDGRVVASYAEPVGLADSYRPMYAAACSGPNDCWFGGERLPAGLNSGAFHLHWNGKALTPLPSLETAEAQIEDPAQTVKSMAFYKGHLYESVQIEGRGPGESSSQPFLIHKIVEGSSKPFVPMIVEGFPGEAFSYSGDPALALSADSSALWAAAGSTVLTLNAAGQFQQLKLDDPSGALAGGAIDALAAEPGSGDAWVSLVPPGGASEALAQVARIDANGMVEPADLLPEAGEQLAHKGSAGAIACPAAGDCWVASSQGWLFHLGGTYPEDNNPYFQSLITYRPPDASIPFVAPETYPEDDSGANPPQLPAPPVARVTTTGGGDVRAPLFSDVKEKLVHGTTLALTFTLATKSHVELVALRKQRTVAHTRGYVLPHGRHTLKLRLNRALWPTKLDLQVRAIGSVPLVPVSTNGSHEAIGGPTAVTTSYRPSGRRG